MPAAQRRGAGQEYEDCERRLLLRRSSERADTCLGGLETGEVLAFHHTRPFWPVHIVVIPKTHVPSLIDLGDTDEVLLHKVLAVASSRGSGHARIRRVSRFNESRAVPGLEAPALPRERRRTAALKAGLCLAWAH